jgi:CheY-like chemotaxis protein
LFVVLAFSDTGLGMDAATCARVFEPFFTTKGSRGTGLGLATVHRIVQQSGGVVEVVSAPGEGTTFEVFLPCAGETPEPDAAARPSRTAQGGGETILLVEDEDGVRELAGHTLELAGFQVLRAAAGAEALEISGRHEGPIHLLLTDVVMPRMSGRELAVRLKKIRPSLKVLYMSGYVDDALVQHGINNEEADFLQKPFDAAGLQAKVREVLDRQDASAPGA